MKLILHNLLFPSFIGAVASIAGGLLANKGRSSAADRSGAFNAVEAQKTRDFQERLSSSAHQRQVADLRKALEI